MLRGFDLEHICDPLTEADSGYMCSRRSDEEIAKELEGYNEAVQYLHGRSW